MFRSGEILDGRYEIIEAIGEGGIGRVYKAKQLSLDKNVAIKELKRFGGTKGNYEVELMKNLKNDALPVFYDVIETRSNIYTVMELIDGYDIEYLCSHGRKFDEKSIKSYAKQLCDAVTYLNEHNIVHGDIKPSNVIINAADKVTLIDFNISSVINSGHADVRGYSPQFSAPEQRKLLETVAQRADEYENDHSTRYLYNADSNTSEKTETKYLYKSTTKGSALISNEEKSHIDERTDVYGIAGVILYMMTKCAPSAGLSKDLNGYSKKFVDAVKTALSDDPEDRFDNAAQFALALEGKYKKKRKKASEKSNNKKKAPYAAIAAGGAVLIAGLAIFILNSQPTPPPPPPIPVTETTTASEPETITEPAKQVFNVYVLKNYSGWNSERVKKAFDKNAIDYEIVEIDSFEEDKGKVLDQYPGEDYYLDKTKEKVTIYIGNGNVAPPTPEDEITVLPGLTGLSQEEAEIRLNKAGIRYTISAVETYPDEKGKIIKQSPVPTDSFNKTKGSVTLFVGNGNKKDMIILPDLTGLSKEDSEKRLDIMGVKYHTESKLSDAAQKDKVIKQTPQPTDNFDKTNGTVTLFIGDGKKVEPAAETAVTSPPYTVTELKVSKFNNGVITSLDNCPWNDVESFEKLINTSRIEYCLYPDGEPMQGPWYVPVGFYQDFSSGWSASGLIEKWDDGSGIGIYVPVVSYINGNDLWAGKWKLEVTFPRRDGTGEYHLLYDYNINDPETVPDDANGRELKYWIVNGEQYAIYNQVYDD